VTDPHPSDPHRTDPFGPVLPGACVAALAGGWLAAAAVASLWAGRPVAAAWSQPVPGWLARGATVVGAAVGVLLTQAPALRRGRRWRRPTAAGWARPADLRPLAVRRPTAGRLTLGYAGRRLVAAERRASLVVLGPSQSGKTRGLAIPAVLEWAGPVLATSVKTDLVRDTIAGRALRGPTWVYDPIGVTGLPTTTWSPLPGCRAWSGARRTAAWLCNGARTSLGIGGGDEDFWYAAAAKLLAPYLLAAAVAGHDAAHLVRWIDAQEEDEVATILEAHPEARAAAWASWNRDDRTRSSVFTTAEMVLEAFADPAVIRSAVTSEIDPARLLGGEPATLYVCAPGHEQERLRPVFATLLHTVITAAYEKGELDPPLLIVLDEAANIAPLRDLDAIASTAAGHGIQLVTVWQDLAQLRARYGDRAATVINNHRAKIVLSAISDPGTLDYASRLIGDAEVGEQSDTIDAAGRRSTTRSRRERRLAPGAELRRIGPGHGVLVYGHLRPARIRLRAPV